ncbi:MAG: hypothetical protein WAR37_02905 [Candidatus Microsaccharimonas sp.]
MATTKKFPAKKKVTLKKGKAQARPVTWKFYVVAIGIFSIAVATFIVIASLTATIISAQQAQARYERIATIYRTIDLGDSYVVQDMDIFGDKRMYSGDKGRSYSSAAHYLHNDTVSNTVAEADARIKAAGFEFIDEPYPGNANTQYHYKSSKGEYVRLTVSSKPRNDAIQNASIMNNGNVADGIYDMDTNAGPSEVVIKVNLDDNNE